MNETNFSEAFIKANQKANIFIDDMDNPIYLCDVRRKQNNIFLTICIVGIAIYIIVKKILFCFLLTSHRKQNNIFLTICIVGIAIYIVSSVVKAKEEAEKRASKFKHYQ